MLSELSLPQLDDIEREIERRQLLSSHIEFVKHFFREAQGQRFIVGPPHKIICDTLDRVFSGEISRLIINIPPGYGKTELAVIMFIAHGFAINPASRFIHASYAQQLALDNSGRVRELINLEAYQKHWPITLKEDSQSKGLWKTKDQGQLRAASSGEPITGFRAGWLRDNEDPWEFDGALIIDDPIKPDDVLSEAERTRINNRWHNTFKSRLGRQKTPVVVIMQRLSVDDFTATLVEHSGEDWHVLKLPVLIDGECEPIGPHAKMIPHGLPPGPLWTDKHSMEDIEILKKRPIEYFGQYQQEPIIGGGNLFKWDWVQRYDELPPLVWRGVYIDTAQKTKERHDFSVIQEWGAGVDGKAYFIDQLRGRWEAPELLDKVLLFWRLAKMRDHKKHGILRKMVVEDKAAGTGLIQEVRRKSIPVVAMQREKDKLTRGLDTQPFLESGLLKIPSTASWVSDFKPEYMAFPDGKHDDQIDPLMDAIQEICAYHFNHEAMGS